METFSDPAKRPEAKQSLCPAAGKSGTLNAAITSSAVAEAELAYGTRLTAERGAHRRSPPRLRGRAGG